jgi:hypothetical protein
MADMGSVADMMLEKMKLSTTDICFGHLVCTSFPRKFVLDKQMIASPITTMLTDSPTKENKRIGLK